MIKVRTNSEKYVYDIHSLVQAFYPGERVRVDHCEGTDLRLNDNEIKYDILFDDDEGSLRIIAHREDGTTGGSVSFTITVSASGGEGTEASTNGTDASFMSEKNLLKRALYEVLSEETGKKLPWGALTGIRPVRIAMNMLRRDIKGHHIRTVFQGMYHVSPEKARLALEIAEREREVLGRRDYENGYSLYIGIPFCPTRCMYCSFSAYPLANYRDAVGNYLECLKKELSAVAELFRDRRLDTVYIGGGTPITLTAAQSDELLSFLESSFDLSFVDEFTVECGRPDSILDDLNKLDVLKAHGVNRICVNPQTMREETLRRIGRFHTVEQTVEAFKAARAAGFDNINMDIILGLPGEGPEDVAYTMKEIAKLKPDDLTVHALAVKRGSKLQADMAADEERRRQEAERAAAVIDALTDTGVKASHASGSIDSAKTRSAYPVSDAMRMSIIAEEGARDMGLKPYYLYRQKNMTGNLENTGFSREGKEGLTNILGMEEVHSIVACGCGTISKRVDPSGLIERKDNVKDLKLYMEHIDEMIERKQRLFGG